MKRILRVACAALALILSAGGNYAGAAVNTYSSVNDLLLSGSSFMSTETPVSWKDGANLSGLFDFVYLGKDASHLNVLLTSGSGEIIFSTGSTGVGTWSDDRDIASLRLDDLSVGGWWGNKQYRIDKWSDAVRIYQLDTNVMISGVSLTAGMFIFGFNDDYKAWILDRPDFDDMVFAARAVPLPGAGMLLGGALLGVIRMRRRATA